MFWKKKSPATETLQYPSDDKRQSFRYVFRKDQQFPIQFMDKQVIVLDISAGGLAFANKGFRQFDFDFIKFTLDIPDFAGDTGFSAGLRILSIDTSGICHCIFEQCSLEQHEIIHKYVLEMQKNDLAH